MKKKFGEIKKGLYLCTAKKQMAAANKKKYKKLQKKFAANKKPCIFASLFQAALKNARLSSKNQSSFKNKKI